MRVWRSYSASARADTPCASWWRAWGGDPAVAGARAAAQVADGAATAAPGARLGRAGEAGGPRPGGRCVLGRGVRRALLHPALLPGGGGARPAARRETAGARAAVVHDDPDPLERHHGAVELLPRQGPGPPRLGAGRLAAALPREARRDAGAFVLDGGAHDRPHSRGLRGGV